MLKEEGFLSSVYSGQEAWEAEWFRNIPPLPRASEAVCGARDGEDREHTALGCLKTVSSQHPATHERERSLQDPVKGVGYI